MNRNEPSTVPTQLHGLHVLVVDDDDGREMLKILREARGARVTAVASALEALEALETMKPDVLVSGIGIPGEDGYELIRRVRERPADENGQVPAIALTAFGGPETRGAVLEAGFQARL